MYHRLCITATYGFNSLINADEHATNMPICIWQPLLLLLTNLTFMSDVRHEKIGTDESANTIENSSIFSLI